MAGSAYPMLKEEEALVAHVVGIKRMVRSNASGVCMATKCSLAAVFIVFGRSDVGMNN